MTSEMPDRPASLRRAPRPAADESVDPVDYRPAIVPAAPLEPAPAQAAPVVAKPTTSKASTAKKPAGSTASTTPPAKPATEPPAAARRGRPRREITVPFSTRISMDVSQLVDEVSSREDITIRSVVEQAIIAKWGDPGK